MRLKHLQVRESLFRRFLHWRSLHVMGVCVATLVVQAQYNALGSHVPPVEAVSMHFRAYAHRLALKHPHAAPAPLVAPSAEAVSSLKRSRPTRRRRRASTFGSAKDGPSATHARPGRVPAASARASRPSRGRRVSRRGAVMLSEREQQQVQWLWMEHNMMTYVCLVFKWCYAQCARASLLSVAFLLFVCTAWLTACDWTVARCMVLRAPGATLRFQTPCVSAP